MRGGQTDNTTIERLHVMSPKLPRLLPRGKIFDLNSKPGTLRVHWTCTPGREAVLRSPRASCGWLLACREPKYDQNVVCKKIFCKRQPSFRVH